MTEPSCRIHSGFRIIMIHGSWTRVHVKIGASSVLRSDFALHLTFKPMIIALAHTNLSTSELHIAVLWFYAVF